MPLPSTDRPSTPGRVRPAFHAASAWRAPSRRRPPTQLRRESASPRAAGEFVCRSSCISTGRAGRLSRATDSSRPLFGSTVQAAGQVRPIVAPLMSICSIMLRLKTPAAGRRGPVPSGATADSPSVRRSCRRRSSCNSPGSPPPSVCARPLFASPRPDCRDRLVGNFMRVRVSKGSGQTRASGCACPVPCGGQGGCSFK